MPRRYLDRGDVLQGINRTVRDSRVPYNVLRSMENFALPDGRARRRPGYKQVSHATSGPEIVFDNWLSKATGSALLKKESSTKHNKQLIYNTPISYGLLRYHSDYKITSAADWTREMYVQLGPPEALVTNPFVRFARKVKGAGTYAFGGTTAAPTDNGVNLRIQDGVYLFDQTILANSLTFNTGNIAINLRNVHMLPDMSAGGNDQTFHSFPLTTMAVLFDSGKLYVIMGMVGKAGGNLGVYFPSEIQLESAFATDPYPDNLKLHVAIQYTASTGVVALLIDGVSADTHTVTDTTNYGFIGEYDDINDTIYASGLGRDIVLLNECTVRGGYGSSCRIQEEMHHHQTFFQSYDGVTFAAANQPAMPWCLSPPRGTCIRDLRFWSDKRTDVELLTNKTTTLPSGESNNVANFPLNDGSAFCRDVENNRMLTLHHGNAAYLSDSGLVHDLGLSIADGQHLIYSTKQGDFRYIQDVHAQLKNLFGFDGRPTGATSTDDFRRIQERHGFTVQMEIRTPHSFQTEWDAVPSGGSYNIVTYDDESGNETGKLSMEGTAGFNNSMSVFALKDGHTDGSQAFLTDGSAHSGAAKQYQRPYDMTLWSIEASTISADDDNHGSLKKVALARGLVSTEKRVIFEVSLGCGFDGVEPRIFRVASSTTLSADTAYSLTFVKRPTYDDAKSPTTPVGIDFEIWIYDLSGAQSTTPDVTHVRKIFLETVDSVLAVNPAEVKLISNHGLAIGTKMPVNIEGTTTTPSIDGVQDATIIGVDTFTVPINVTAGQGAAAGTAELDHTLRSTAIRNEPSIDVIIGASFVNNFFDRGVSAPNPGGTNTGPWLVPQHFMSSWMDQPGFFILGVWRMWTTAITNGEVQDRALELSTSTSMNTKNYTPDLLFNLELEEVSGAQVTNKSRYPIVFDLGYKSWGAGNGFELQPVEILGLSGEFDNLIEPMVPGTAAFEDRLGYAPLFGSPGDYTSTVNAECKTLAAFQTTLTHRFGLIYGFDDHLIFDNSLDGSISPLHIQAGGLLNDFAPKEFWRGTSIGDRTILTSVGGLPKVYNGKNGLVAGFKRYQGGPPIVSVVATVTAKNATSKGLTADRWYGFRIVYESEEYAIRHISDVAVLQTPTGATRAVSIISISPHYDPRITSIRVYRTRAQLTRDFALKASLFPVYEGAKPNSYIPEFYISEDDSLLISAPLNLNQTPLPNCAYSASLGGRLYMAGDTLIPDAVYFSDAGNPERFDTIGNVLILEEASGDKINGLVGLFGILVVFKANSIWLIEEVAAGQHQIRKVSDIGALSDKSIVVVTMPDTGRTSIFFWSQHGPYMFDLTTLQYLGFGVEERTDPGVPDLEYDWLDETSVIGLHDVKNKEVLFLYKSKDSSGNVHGRPDEALAFNYRRRTWYRYTGMIGTVALSQAFTGDDIAGALLAGGAPGPATFQFTHAYKAYLGGSNGRIYEWAKDEEDGLPPDDTVTKYTVLSYAGRVVTLTTSTLSANEYTHLWAVVYRSSSNTWYMIPILANSASTVTLDENTNYPIDFDPALNDNLYVCLPPAQLVFPWDQMDAPFVEKQIVNLLTWHNKEFLVQISKDWNSADKIVPYKTLATPNVAEGRSRLTVGKTMEAAKLDLVSFEKGATFNGFAYEIEYFEDAVTKQG